MVSSDAAVPGSVLPSGARWSRAIALSAALLLEQRGHRAPGDSSRSRWWRSPFTPAAEAFRYRFAAKTSGISCKRQVRPCQVPPEVMVNTRVEVLSRCRSIRERAELQVTGSGASVRYRKMALPAPSTLRGLDDVIGRLVNPPAGSTS